MNLPAELLKELRDRLSTELGELDRRHQETVGRMVEDEAFRKGDSIDISTAEQLDATELRFSDRSAERAHAVRAALARLDAGTFGECAECGDEIGVRRLQANPIAVLCIDCQEEAEAANEVVHKLRPGLMDEF